MRRRRLRCAQRTALDSEQIGANEWDKKDVRDGLFEGGVADKSPQEGRKGGHQNQSQDQKPTFTHLMAARRCGRGRERWDAFVRGIHVLNKGHVNECQSDVENEAEPTPRQCRAC